MNRILNVLGRYPKTSIAASWSISLSVAVFVLVLADFGGPRWIFLLCGLWLGSLGLPTTLSLLVLAALWGRLPGMETPSLSAFAICGAILSLIFQTMSFHAVIRLRRRWGHR
jgi:hypothetical protein